MADTDITRRQPYHDLSKAKWQTDAQPHQEIIDPRLSDINWFTQYRSQYCDRQRKDNTFQKNNDPAAHIFPFPANHASNAFIITSVRSFAFIPGKYFSSASAGIFILNPFPEAEDLAG